MPARWDALMRLQEKDIIVPESGGVRLAGEREYSFKHVLIRDVAYGMLPRAVRVPQALPDRPLHRGARRRAHRRGRRAAGRALRPRPRPCARRPRWKGRRSGRSTRRRSSTWRRPATPPRACTPTRRPTSTTRPCAALEITEDPATVARVLEKQGDVAFRMGRVGTAVELWEECLEHHRQQEDLTRVADLHRKIGAGLWNQGERKLAIERYQKGINLLKDGPPCLELVHLYEEAASLYMHAGDNMLAIYASEKALRLAEKLQETRVASRAHGIFGRVFGRIGDKEKARENLERSVELARDSDDGETIRALLTLGHHLEVSEADYAGAGQAYGEALQLAQQVGDLPAQVELQSSIAQVAVIPRGLGRGRDRRRGERRPGRTRGPGGQALLPAACCAACWPGARAAGTMRRSGARAPTSWPSRSGGRRSRLRRSTGSVARCATAGTTRRRSPR